MCLRPPALGFCSKKHLLIFCLTETGGGGRGPTQNFCLTIDKNEQKFEDIFFWIFFENIIVKLKS